jgi:sulfoxide reductase heme-binding subunit YedZ
MLAITLAITPARRLFGWNGLAKYRRMLGLFVFFYATVHLLIYLGLDMQLDGSDIVEDIIEHKYVTIGMFAWLTLVPLAITSTKGWIRRLGKRWTKLHRLVYVTAFAGTIHYLWAVKKDNFLPLVYLTIFVVLLGYRVVAWQANRRRAAMGVKPAPKIATTT